MSLICQLTFKDVKQHISTGRFWFMVWRRKRNEHDGSHHVLVGRIKMKKVFTPSRPQWLHQDKYSGWTRQGNKYSVRETWKCLKGQSNWQKKQVTQQANVSDKFVADARSFYDTVLVNVALIHLSWLTGCCTSVIHLSVLGRMSLIGF